jgi:hypothetical protein
MIVVRDTFAHPRHSSTRFNGHAPKYWYIDPSPELCTIKCQVPKTGVYTAHCEDKHEVKEKDRQQHLIGLLTTGIALQQRTKVAAPGGSGRSRGPRHGAFRLCVRARRGTASWKYLCRSRTHHCAREHIVPDGAGGYKLQRHQPESRGSRRRMTSAPPRCL